MVDEGPKSPTEIDLQAIGLLQERGLMPIEGNKDYLEAVRIVEGYKASGNLFGFSGKPVSDVPPDPAQNSGS